MSELLPEDTSDDRDEGWGEAATRDAAEAGTIDGRGDLDRFLLERPPHHGTY